MVIPGRLGLAAHAAAVGSVVGALLQHSFGIWVCAAAVVVAVARRVPVVIGFALLVVASSLGARALDGIEPTAAGPFQGWVTLLDDPRSTGAYSVRATARVAGDRMTLSAHGPLSGRLEDRLSGESVWVAGTIRPTAPDNGWARWRHLTGRLSVDAVGEHSPGSPITRAANAIRRTLSRGADALPDAQRALLLGMVIGDDRDQSPVVADDFRAAGLGHLLVVSGQNVAFVLALVTPLIVWARPGFRLVVLGVVLLFFAVLTRFEPSVLRAVAMAAFGIGGIALGRPVSGRWALSVAVTALLMIDPFLVRVLAFQLSAAATAAIVWLAGPIAERLRGPPVVRVAFATTAAAQLGVAPLLLARFGPMPLATLPANLLAGPLAGPVMVWGWTAGLAAGVFGGVAAVVLHWPTRVMLDWIGGIAAAAASAPQAELGLLPVTAAAIAVASTILCRRRIVGSAAIAALVFTLVVSIRSAPSLESGAHDAASGVVAHHQGGAVVVVLEDPDQPRRLLGSLRESGVRRIDLVVAADGDLADAVAVVALTDRYGPVIVAPPMHRVPGARTVRAGDAIRVGELVVTVESDTPSLVVLVSGSPSTPR